MENKVLIILKNGEKIRYDGYWNWLDINEGDIDNMKLYDWNNSMIGIISKDDISAIIPEKYYIGELPKCECDEKLVFSIICDNEELLLDFHAYLKSGFSKDYYLCSDIKPTITEDYENNRIIISEKR